VIGGLPSSLRGLTHVPLFQFEILAVLPPGHRLAGKSFLQPRDFVNERLITYPVPESRIDLIRQVLAPAGIAVQRRTAELTVAIMQLVASHRGLAALPSWGIQNYVDYQVVVARPITRKGLWSELHAVGRKDTMERPYTQDLVRIIVETCARTLRGIRWS
jgi:LysR family transcriptional regulator for metE and metH